MAREQLERRGITDQRVLDAMRTVPRELFVPDRQRSRAYEDGPLPIGEGQTISQPYIVALMAHALKLQPDDEVLEVGAGSGYAAAVMSRLARSVHAVERHQPLVECAQASLREAGYENVRVMHANGTLGCPENAPFDAIAVAAGGPEPPPALLEQLKIGGRLVMPIGSRRGSQELVRVTRLDENRWERESLGTVRFVPLVGEHGWDEDGR
jgi:protein-L-isoaspartate(D-aspartate) O-methyltransferase